MMHSAAQANMVLRQHMLYISASLMVESGVVSPLTTVQQTAFTRGSTGSGGGGSSNQHQRFSRVKVVDVRNESVQHASRHVEAVEESVLGGDVEALREALIAICSSTQRFPVPQVSLAELLRIFHEHMQYHTDSDGAIAGDYVLRSLSLFFVCDRTEAYQKYALPLVELGVLRPWDSNHRSQVRFEMTRFAFTSPHLIQPHLFPLRETLSRFVCIFCHRSCVEGGNELIYLSHSRWTFSPKPTPPYDATDSPIDSPFSPFPESLRRGFIGPIMQFVTSFCIADFKIRDSWGSDCCIVRLDGVKIALCLLTLNNTSMVIENPEKGCLDRCDCQTTVMMGFPEEVPDVDIRLGLQRIFDVIEMHEGPRAELGALLGQSSEEFRWWCRLIGDKIFHMISDIFFNQQRGGYTFALHHDWELMLSSRVPERWRVEKSSCGLSLCGSQFLNPVPRTAPVSQRTFALASNLRWSFERSIVRALELEKGSGCLATVLLVGGQVILSDCHPYLSSLLSIEQNLHEHTVSNLQIPFGSMGDDTFGGCRGRGDARYAPRLCDCVVHTTSRGSLLLLAWRYFSASVLSLMQCDHANDASGRFLRSVTVKSGDVHLVMLVSAGSSTPTDRPVDGDMWDELASASLRQLVKHEHEMMMMSSVVAERETPQRRQEVAACESSTVCISHDLTTGTATLLNYCGDVPSSGGNSACESHLVKEMPYVQALLGHALSPKRRFSDDMMAHFFAFAELPVTRAVLGRTAFGACGVGIHSNNNTSPITNVSGTNINVNISSNTMNNSGGGNNKECRGVGVVYGRLAGGQERYFTDMKYATFQSVEDNYLSFISARMGEGDVMV